MQSFEYLCLINNIRQAIERKGLKQKAVAEKAGFTANELSAMLNNRKIIKAEYVFDIANALEVDPNELYGIMREG